MPVRRKLVIEEVTHLLQRAKVTAPPVPVERIAADLGLQLRYEPLEGDLSGCLIRKDKTATVGINSTQNANRQRFTLAHEIGHFLLHKGQEVIVDRTFRVNRRDTLSQKAEDPEEIEANFFAAELLMPRRLLEQELKSGSFDILDDDKIFALAQRLEVSVQALNYRLTNLGYLEAVN